MKSSFITKPFVFDNLVDRKGKAENLFKDSKVKTNKIIMAL